MGNVDSSEFSGTSRLCTSELSGPELKAELEKALRAFTTYNEDERDFMRAFPVWARERRSNILTLERIAVRLSKIKREYNENSAGASAMAVAGTLVTGASYVVRFISPVVGTAMLFGGRAVAALGSVAGLALAIGEPILTEEKMQEAKAALRKDQRDFNLMCHWFEYSILLKKTIEKLEQRYDFKYLFDVIATAIKKLPNFYQSGKSCQKLLFNLSSNAYFKKLKRTNKNLYWNLLKIISSPITLDLFIKLQKEYLRISFFLKRIDIDLQKTMENVKLALVIGNTVCKMPFVSKVASRGVSRFLGAANFVIQVLEVLESDEKIKENRSEHAAVIESAVKEMEAELRSIRTIYETSSIKLCS